MFIEKFIGEGIQSRSSHRASIQIKEVAWCISKALRVTSKMGTRSKTFLSLFRILMPPTVLFWRWTCPSYNNLHEGYQRNGGTFHDEPVLVVEPTRSLSEKWWNISNDFRNTVYPHTHTHTNYFVVQKYRACLKLCIIMMQTNTN